MMHSFSIELLSDQSPASVFEAVRNIGQWWCGQYGEDISGNWEKPGDEFVFKAGDGAHYSRQKMVECIPPERIVWEIVESKLSYLDQPDEWNGSALLFEIEAQDGKTRLRFTHRGLMPTLACYDSCSTAWNKYWKNSLAPLLNASI
ncbi:MAG TPA: SRPBCC domain-containing protein [Chitinophagaceae bacterium]|nr:SRPBCC domain-containing protein [Chitinophagaceae bacterium]